MSFRPRLHAAPQTSNARSPSRFQPFRTLAWGLRLGARQQPTHPARCHHRPSVSSVIPEFENIPFNLIWCHPPLIITLPTVNVEPIPRRERRSRFTDTTPPPPQPLGEHVVRPPEAELPSPPTAALRCQLGINKTKFRSGRLGGRPKVVIEGLRPAEGLKPAHCRRVSIAPAFAMLILPPLPGLESISDEGFIVPFASIETLAIIASYLSPEANLPDAGTWVRPGSGSVSRHSI